jgi:energy-coupling factor transport system permease protein
MGALAFVLFVWLFTTDQTALVRGLVGLGLPYEWGLTLGMALRYLPTMASAFVMISDAQQARGLDLAKRNPLQRARAYIPITVAMLITALRTAEGISYTLESRALGASRRRTDLHPLRYTTRDMWWTLVILAGTAMLLWARFAWGWGAGPL